MRNRHSLSVAAAVGGAPLKTARSRGSPPGGAPATRTHRCRHCPPGVRPPRRQIGRRSRAVAAPERPARRRGTAARGPENQIPIPRARCGTSMAASSRAAEHGSNISSWRGHLPATCFWRPFLRGDQNIQAKEQRGNFVLPRGRSVKKKKGREETKEYRAV